MAKRHLKRALSRSRGRTHLIAAGALTLALGGIVLLRAPTHAAEAPSRVETPDDGRFAANRFQADGLTGSIELSQRAVQVGAQGLLLAEINLAAEEQRTARRSPVAVSVVLDTSGSMRGEKIVQARNAVRQVVERLDDSDYVSLITYESQAQVRVALTRVGDVRHNIGPIVRSIQAAGGTMIPGALDLGAGTLREAPSHYVRRVVLVSDGQDGSGLSDLSVRQSIQRHAQSNIAFSAMGLGVDYNEAFLTNVADAGAGNYAFVAAAADLHPFLQRELEAVRSTLFDNVVAELTLPAGWSVTRGFGITHTMNDGVATIRVGQIASGQHRKVTVELRGPSGALGDEQLFNGRLHFRSVSDSEQHSLRVATMSVRTVASENEAFAARVEGVFSRTNAVAIDEAQREAVDAWRGGDAERAAELSQGNRYRLERLRRFAPASAAPQLRIQAEALAEEEALMGALGASSAEGRAFGLSTNSARRARSQ